MRDLVYISYCHRDKRIHRQLREVLDLDVRTRDIIWDDTKITKGGNVWTQIAAHVERAKVMVMLVSPDYLAKDCSAWDCEITPALEAVKQADLTILWIPVRAVKASDTPFPFIQPATDLSRPLDRLSANERKKTLEEVRDDILRLMEIDGSGHYDVFLSHNSADKPTVKEVGEALTSRGLRVWLDEWELRPGQPWQEALEDIIQTAKSAAVFVGQEGMGPWEIPEMRACLSEFVERRLPVIPVLLPGLSDEPELPLFLRQFTWVDLRDGLSSDGIDHIVYGITCQSPGRSAESPQSRESAWRKKRRREQFEPAVRLTALQMLGLFVFLALFSVLAFYIDRLLGSVFVALTAAVVLFGFLGGVAEAENRWGRFGGSAAVFVVTLLLMMKFSSPMVIPDSSSESAVADWLREQKEKNTTKHSYIDFVKARRKYEPGSEDYAEVKNAVEQHYANKWKCIVISGRALTGAVKGEYFLGLREEGTDTPQLFRIRATLPEGTAYVRFPDQAPVLVSGFVHRIDDNDLQVPGISMTYCVIEID